MPLKLKSLNNQEPGAGGGSNKMPAKNKKTMKSKGMKRGGKMKSKGMKRGGKAKR